MVGDGLGEEDVGGDGKGGVKFVVSTVVEAEELVGYLKKVQGEGRKGSVSFLYFLCGDRGAIADQV
jgi:hypothetical protein